MSTTTKIVQSKYAKSDGTYSIDMRLTHNRRSVFIPTGVFVGENDWNEADKEIKRSCKLYKSIPRVNDYLVGKRKELNSFISDLLESGQIESMTATQIKKAFRERNKHAISFNAYAKKLIREFKKTNKLGNASVYQQALDFTEKHTSGEISFSQIDYAFIKKLEKVHLEAGFGYNSLSVKLRTIRAIYNKAINEGIPRQEWYPFTKYKIKQTKTQKRAISKEDILQIEKYEPEFGSPEFHARNYFMFSFYMIGMNFSDIAHLKYSNIKKDRLEYHRKKTGKFYNLELYDKPKAIIDIYRKNNFIFNPEKTDDNYIFPIIKREDPELIRADIYNGLKLLNKYIRRIADELEINAHLTSYVARHSWASIGKALNIPLSVISDGLGHEDLSTTQVYLDELDKSTIDQASKIITG